jgi:hypothetical protein
LSRSVWGIWRPPSSDRTDHPDRFIHVLARAVHRKERHRGNRLHDDVEALNASTLVDLGDAGFYVPQPRLFFLQRALELRSFHGEHRAQLSRRDLFFQHWANLHQ